MPLYCLVVLFYNFAIRAFYLIFVVSNFTKYTGFLKRNMVKVGLYKFAYSAA